MPHWKRSSRRLSLRIGSEALLMPKIANRPRSAAPSYTAIYLWRSLAHPLSNGGTYRQIAGVEECWGQSCLRCTFSAVLERSFKELWDYREKGNWSVGAGLTGISSLEQWANRGKFVKVREYTSSQWLIKDAIESSCQFIRPYVQ